MNNLKKTLITASYLVLSVVPLRSQSIPAKPTNVTAVAMATTISRPVSDMRPTRTPVVRVVVVSLEDRRLALVEDGVVTKVYRVAVGSETTPSPIGTFTIVNRVENPTYYHEGKVIPAGPGNPVGTRWIGLDRRGYGIHGTDVPQSIGKAASHGCIRMRRRDLEELFAEVRGGDEVEILGERNEETAAIFGEPAIPAPVKVPVHGVTAQTTPEAPAQPTAAEGAAAAAIVPAMLPVNQ